MTRRVIMGMPEEEWNRLSSAEKIAYLDRMLRLLKAATPDEPIDSSAQDPADPSSRNRPDAAGNSE